MTSLEQHLEKHVLREQVWGWQCGCLFHSYGKNLALTDVRKLHAAHVAAAWRESRTVRTVEAAAALPVGTIVKDANGRFLRGNDGPDTSHLLDLPAFIVWTPEDGAL